MSRGSRLALVLLSLLNPSAAVRAGVYVTTPREPFPVPTALDKVKNRLGTLMMLDDRAQKPEKEPSPERKELLKEVARLEARHQKGELSLPERVNLSAAYIRLGRNDRAVKLLREAVDEGPEQVKDDTPERFLLLANLAAAYNDGNIELLPRAIFEQEKALKAASARPPVADWTQEQWDHYRITEGYFLKLLKLRRGEGRKAAMWKTVDALFDQVRFVGPSGEYEAGKVSAEELHALPRDALPIVAQLVYWLPADARLYWQYGEILNAEGQSNDASRVLDELRDLRGLGSIPELNNHRRVLKAAYRAPKEEEPVAPPDEPQPAKAAPARDWRSLGTGFLAGLLVAAFGGLQLYIWLRRRRGPGLPSRPEHSPPAALAGAGRSEGIVPGDPGHVTAPRDHS
jgi:hypothetical protein